MHNALKETTATSVDKTFTLLLAMKSLFRAPHVQPNGPALSCGVDKFQIAENETSSCDKPN
jgi:hypothetical protein